MSNGETQPNPNPPASVLGTPDEFERLLDKSHRPVGVFEDAKSFAQAQRVAKMLTLSKMMPEHFQGDANLGSAVIAVDIAFRLKLSPFLVAKQIYMVYDKPAFSAQFMIAVMNSAADFGKIRYDLQTNGIKEFTYSYTEGYRENKVKKSATVKLDDWVCVAWALEGEQKLPNGINTLAKAKEAGLPILEGPPVSMGMAVKEGWYAKDGSKWQTLPDLMLRYRAATFFGRLYAPELMMGLSTVDEIEDLGPSEPTFSRPVFGKPSEPAKKEPEPTTTPASPPAQPAPEAAAPKTTIEPPPEAATPPAAIQEPAAGFNPVRAVRGLCKNDKISEDLVLKFLKEIGSVKDTVNSLEEIHLANDKVLVMVAEQWSDIVKKMKGVV